MNEPLTVASVAGAAWHDFRHGRRALFLFDILFKLAQVWLLVPVVAVVLAAVLWRAGHVAVSNLDIVDFLWTPSGLVYAGIFATMAVATLLLEQSGIMVLAALSGADKRPTVKEAFHAALRRSLKILELGAIKALLLAL